MRHWIQSVKDRWKTTLSDFDYLSDDYDPTKDFNKHRRKAQEKERKRLAAWRKQMKTTLNSNYSIGHLPGVYSSGIVTASNISNSAITINNDPVNGSVTIDVPLSVNGRDILKELDEMRDSLLLLKRNVDMEEKYPRLRELKDEYERALEKYKTFDTLKESK